MKGFFNGAYMVTATAIKVRTGAGTHFFHKEAKDTVSAVANTLGKAVYTKGMIIEVAEVLKITDKEVWGRTVDGYVALMYDGKRYVKKEAWK